MKNIMIFIVSSFVLSSCSTYPTKFKGSPAKGTWGALPMDVSRMVDNGDAEAVYQSSGKIRDYESKGVQSEYPDLISDGVNNIVYMDAE